MSFREKAKAVLAEGAEERKNYSPKADSVPLRMYNYWANTRPSRVVPKRENFCHYWRVVAIWAPVWFLLYKFEDFVVTRKGQVILGVVVLVSVALLLSLVGAAAWGILGMVLAIAYALFGLIIGLVAVGTRNDSDGFIADMGYKPMNIFIFSWIAYVIGLGVQKLAGSLSERAWESIGKYVAYACGVAAIGMLLFLLVVGIINAPLAMLIAAGLIVGTAALVAGLWFLADFLKSKHRKSVKARTTWVKQEMDGYEYEAKVVEPSRLAKFFMTIGDFLNLAFQVVRVKKWKICPIVEIPQ